MYKAMAQRMFGQNKKEWKPNKNPSVIEESQPQVDEEAEFKKFIKSVVDGAIKTIKATPLLKRGAQKTLRKHGLIGFSKLLTSMEVPHSFSETEDARFISIRKPDMEKLFGETPEGEETFKNELALIREDNTHPFTQWMGLSSFEDGENLVFRLLK